MATRVNRAAWDVLTQVATESGSSIYDVSRKVLEDWASSTQNHFDEINEAGLGNGHEDIDKFFDKETT